MTHEQTFQQLLAKAGTAAGRATFFSNLQAELKNAGIPLLETMSGTLGSIDKAPAASGAAVAAPNYQCRAETHWWGIDIIMNEDLTQAIATGAIVGPPLASLCAGALAAAGIVTGPIAAVIGGAFATALALKIVEIKLIDRGQGVHWPISWLQWGTVIAAAPMGPPGIVAAILVFFHPVPN